MTETDARPSVTVAVCTFRRNASLAALVRTVNELAAAEPVAKPLRMLIVDDSPEGAAKDVVTELRGTLSIDLEYEATAASDISVARNRALEVGASSEFVACVDDDCLPNPGWLRELLRIAGEHNADIVVGHRQFVGAIDAPRWLLNEPFLKENLRYADGSVPLRGNTANMLVRSSWWMSSGVTFRREMGQLGGEDMVMFSDAAKAGANIRFAADSVCDEPCAGQRATFRYQAWRQLWLGNNEAAINRATRAESRALLAARGAKRIALGIVHPLSQLARFRTPQWRWSLALAGRGIGLLLGTAGIRLRHRG